MIDAYHISVIPVLLGKGIRLFQEIERGQRLRLLRTVSGNGITELVYVRR